MKHAIRAAIFVGGLAIGYYTAEFLAVDACLDDGGRWRDHRAMGVCEGIKPN